MSLESLSSLSIRRDFASILFINLYIFFLSLPPIRVYSKFRPKISSFLKDNHFFPFHSLISSFHDHNFHLPAINFPPNRIISPFTIFSPIPLTNFLFIPHFTHQFPCARPLLGWESPWRGSEGPQCHRVPHWC